MRPRAIIAASTAWAISAFEAALREKSKSRT
jgi:hypothetical protein